MPISNGPVYSDSDLIETCETYVKEAGIHNTPKLTDTLLSFLSYVTNISVDSLLDAVCDN